MSKEPKTTSPAATARPPVSFAPAAHTNPGFDELLARLGRQLSDMVHGCERAISDTCAALSADGDAAAAKRVIKLDETINQLEQDVSETVATCVARYQPVASDLHALMSAVKAAADLERLADHAKNICRRLRWLDKDRADLGPLRGGLVALGQQVHAMLKEVIDAEADGDMSHCARIWEMDIETNEQYQGIMERIVDKNTDADRRALINALLIAKNFERIGDKIKNLAEEIYFQRTGDELETQAHDD